MSIDAKARYAAAGFVALLLLSWWWPAPVVSVKRLWKHRDLPVDELSFLGREAPSWDVVFWCVAGLFAIAVVQSGERLWPPPRFRVVFATRNDGWAIGAGIATIAATWFFLDRPLVALAERVQSDSVDDWIRIANRLGGGMNPVLIVLFFLIAGVVYRREQWLRYGVAMTIAGLGAGLVAQIIKFIVGRVRPELWLGPFHY